MIHKDKQDKWFHTSTATVKAETVMPLKGKCYAVYPDTVRIGLSSVNECIEPPIKDESILSEAERIVNGDRQVDYSDPVENFKHISAIASSISKENLSPTTCAIVMIAVKLARENYKHKRDNLVDLAGYVEILNRIKESEVSL